MITKKAIEFVDHMANSFKCISSLNCKDIDNKKNEVVVLLEQGEAYKQMWGEWKEEWGSKIICEHVEKKYFPKEVS